MSKENDLMLDRYGEPVLMDFLVMAALASGECPHHPLEHEKRAQWAMDAAIAYIAIRRG